VSSINIDSYEPNLAICEYLANRCQQSSLNCLRKLNDILTRKLKRNPNRTDCQTESIIKLNIAILFILQGKRDNALVILNDIYHNRDCFIEFMQSRIFLLILVGLLTFRN
jgi:predicted negative regulator of RcsB-dependent stress response